MGNQLGGFRAINWLIHRQLWMKTRAKYKLYRTIRVTIDQEVLRKNDKLCNQTSK